MKTYNLIINAIKSELNSKSITTVKQCRERIESLCNEYGYSDMFSIAYEFGVA